MWGLDAVRAAAAPGELTGLDAAFAANRAAALQNLAGAADVQILLPDGAIPVDTEVQVKVRVFNRTGHKLPTGYADGRRVFLELRVDGQVVSGAYDGDAGMLLPDPQLAVFEAVHARSDGGLDHLALHDTILKDTRIEPLGFRPDEDTGPVGISFLRDPDGGAMGAVEWTYRMHRPGERARLGKRDHRGAAVPPGHHPRVRRGTRRGQPHRREGRRPPGHLGVHRPGRAGADEERAGHGPAHAVGGGGRWMRLPEHRQQRRRLPGAARPPGLGRPPASGLRSPARTTAAWASFTSRLGGYGLRRPAPRVGVERPSVLPGEDRRTRYFRQTASTLFPSGSRRNAA